MITRREAGGKNFPLWQQQMSNAFTSPVELLDFLEIDPDCVMAKIDENSDFPLRVPLPFAERMKKGDPEDPLLKQVLPLKCESESIPGFTRDPLQEGIQIENPGILRKYHGRTLMITTGACGAHCRYCFRRHFPYGEAGARRDDVERLWQLPDENSEEVILSGGDPLSLNDRRLSGLLSQLQKVAGLRRLRIHTRIPVLLPSRVTDELCHLLGKFPHPIIVVLHINHPNELDACTAQAFSRLRSAGIQLLNQAVLLHGINDNADILEKLSKKGFDAGVLPYYLHQLDPVHGSAHFQVSNHDAVELITSLRKRLPGYLVPRLVREYPGAPSKTPLPES